MFQQNWYWKSVAQASELIAVQFFFCAFWKARKNDTISSFRWPLFSSRWRSIFHTSSCFRMADAVVWRKCCQVALYTRITALFLFLCCVSQEILHFCTLHGRHFETKPKIAVLRGRPGSQCIFSFFYMTCKPIFFFKFLYFQGFLEPMHKGCVT